ncbi:hypothetical protein VULLAG_LOCUS19399 [Vulpes lagopus]
MCFPVFHFGPRHPLPFLLLAVGSCCSSSLSRLPFLAPSPPPPPSVAPPPRTCPKVTGQVRGGRGGSEGERGSAGGWS